MKTCYLLLIVFLNIILLNDSNGKETIAMEQSTITKVNGTYVVKVNEDSFNVRIWKPKYNCSNFAPKKCQKVICKYKTFYFKSGACNCSRLAKVVECKRDKAMYNISVVLIYLHVVMLCLQSLVFFLPCLMKQICRCYLSQQT